ncbi:MAG: hypothetical protein ACEY3G_03905 [Arsenophonus sp.]
MRKDIFEEFDAECVGRFLKLIIDKEAIFYLDGTKSHETFAIKYEISHHRLNNVG